MQSAKQPSLVVWQTGFATHGAGRRLHRHHIECDSKTHKPHGALASRRKQVSPTPLRLTIRTGVKFIDGPDFSAANAKFSLARAKAKTSNFTVYALGVDRSRWHHQRSARAAQRH